MTATEEREHIERTNMLERRQEAWRPPVFVRIRSRRDAVLAALRRAVDLQAGSIWRDLKCVLPHVTGIVIDVGCGAQPYRSLLSAQAEYIGIDTVDALEKFGYEIPDTKYFAGDVWPVKKECAAAVLCAEVLEHVPQPDLILREAYRCLKPGGKLLLTVPFAARWHFVPHDFWRFTPSGLNLLASDAGFVDVRVYARGNAVTVACYKCMALILRLALPECKSLAPRLARQFLALPLLPILLLLAGIAQISLRRTGGDDCLGYTLIAKKGAA